MVACELANHKNQETKHTTKTARRRSPGQICVSPSQGQRSKQRKALTSTCSWARVQCKGRYPDTSAIAEKDDVGARCVTAPLPIAGSGPVATTMDLTGPGQWHRQKPLNERGVSGWTWLLCHVKRESVAGTNQAWSAPHRRRTCLP